MKKEIFLLFVFVQTLFRIILPLLTAKNKIFFVGTDLLVSIWFSFVCSACCFFIGLSFQRKFSVLVHHFGAVNGLFLASGFVNAGVRGSRAKAKMSVNGVEKDKLLAYILCLILLLDSKHFIF